MQRFGAANFTVLTASQKYAVAVVVRLNANEDAADLGKYLVVSRVDGVRTCVVRVVKSSASALDAARNMADHTRELKPRSSLSVGERLHFDRSTLRDGAYMLCNSSVSCVCRRVSKLCFT